MAEKSIKDLFSNQGAISCTESAANTLTFKKLETGINFFEKVAWVISRIDFYPTDLTTTQFANTDDALDIAYTTANSISDIKALDNPGVLFWKRFQLAVYAAGTLMRMNEFPFVADFSTLKGGGILVPPNPLYLGIKGTGLTGVATVLTRFYYTSVQLATDEYWELVEARRMIAS